MPREISTTTQRDLDFMKLRDEILGVIKTKKDWREFKEYMDVYYYGMKTYEND